ncbi:ParB/RepB/Spo0J family partition protein [Plantactinospora mayteni]|nr:ParB N-terminal domain-containing protein [Plantactinospora mayteni]
MHAQSCSEKDDAVDSGVVVINSETSEVRVDDLLPADSPRLQGEDSGHVQVLAESESSLPPILVHRQTMRVIDGMHRLRVAQLRGRSMVEVKFFDGSEEDAFAVAVAANRAHGLPLTLADREAAAERIIRAQPHRSDRSIAAISGLAARTVADIRRRLGSDVAATISRVGRDGRVRPLNPAEGRRAASEAIAERPEASLREIARSAGVSLATARDVRERLRRGDDPLPGRQLGPRQQAGSRPAARVGAESQPNAGRAPMGRAVYSRERGRSAMLDGLSRDPSLRFTESGRRLLHWLFSKAKGPEGWEEVLDSMPPHCAYVVLEVAIGCADEWSRFATQVQQRLRDSA